MITDHVKKVGDRIRGGEFTSEAAVSQGILLPALHWLGWPVFDTTVVVPEYSVEGRRVDFALCHPAERPSVFIEVKKIGHSDGADRQLFEYAFHAGVPMAILTDGQEWSFYLPGEQGRYDERRVYKLDLLERSVEEAVERLEEYLRYERVCSGEALRSARADYQNVTRDREIDVAVPRAWRSLLEEPDALLLDLLAEKTENLCGYKPDSEVCSKFLANRLRRSSIVSSAPVAQPRERPRPSTIGYPRRVSRTKTLDGFSFSFEGKSYQARSAREVMEKVFKLLASADPQFLDRFAARKHGRKRRYIARDKSELYPGRPDLAQDCSLEIAPGWWMGTNYSRSNIQQILDLALEVADPRYRSSLKINVLY